MDQIIRLAARHCLLAVCAFPMFISPVYALNFHAAPLEPERRIYDNADIFSDAEEIELNAALSERSADSRTHFVILTANGNTIEGLEGFSREFYETNIMGKGGVSNCAMLTIDMSIRQVAIDGYGELRQMASDSEWSVIRERLTPELTNGDYAAAARIFLEDSYPLVDSKYELYYTDTPTVDPSERLYDFAGVLSDEQYNELADRIKQISEKRGADFIIAIIEEPVGEEYSTVDYLERFAGSFYKRNFSEAAEYAGAYLLVISPQTQTAGASPFGTFIVENYDLYLTNSGVTDKLEYSVYSACDYFLYEQEEVWILEHMEIPAADPSKLIFDNSDLFTAGEEEDLWVQLREKADRHKVDLYILTTDYWSDDTVYRFQSDFISKNLYATENFLLLTIGGLPAIEGE
ncbi:MAG: TPM domain-containing protein, partial [Clostridiales bacterium]|nr:TPM domain-containing protein [Clostridiales bacterium]